MLNYRAGIYPLYSYLFGKYYDFTNQAPEWKFTEDDSPASFTGGKLKVDAGESIYCLLPSSYSALDNFVLDFTIKYNSQAWSGDGGRVSIEQEEPLSLARYINHFENQCDSPFQASNPTYTTDYAYEGNYSNVLSSAYGDWLSNVQLNLIPLHSSFQNLKKVEFAFRTYDDGPTRFYFIVFGSTASFSNVETWATYVGFAHLESGYYLDVVVNQAKVTKFNYAQWNTVRQIIDWDNQTFDLYLNDTLIGQYPFWRSFSSSSRLGWAVEETSLHNDTKIALDYCQVQSTDPPLWIWSPDGNINIAATELVNGVVADTEYRFKVAYIPSTGVTNVYLLNGNTWELKTTLTMTTGTPTSISFIGGTTGTYYVDDVVIHKWDTQPFIAEIIPTSNRPIKENVDRYKHFRKLIAYTLTDMPREGGGFQLDYEERQSIDYYEFIIRDTNRSNTHSIFNTLRDILINQHTSGYYSHFDFLEIENSPGAGQYEISFKVGATIAGKAREDD